MIIKKILVISNLFPPFAIGGYEIAAFDICCSLALKNYKVYVLTSKNNCKQITINNFKVLKKLNLIQYYFKKFQRKSRKQLKILNYLITKKIINTIKPHLIYFWNPNFLGGGPVCAANESKIPVVHHVMGYDLLKYTYNYKRPWEYAFKKLKNCISCEPSNFLINSKKINCTIFISRFMQNYFASQEGISPQHSCVIHPGIRVNLINQKTTFTLKKIISVLYVGRISAHKGVELIKTSLNSLSKNYKFELFLYGEGEGSYINNFIKESKFKVNFKGWQPRHILYKEIHKYDFGVFPSIWDEPFGIAQIEMMAAGMPIITSGKGGSCEAIIDNVNGLFFKSGDHNDLSKKILYLLSNYKNKAPMLSKMARKTACIKFSKQESVNKIIAFLSRAEIYDQN